VNRSLAAADVTDRSTSRSAAHSGRLEPWL
jgi:hypothetical protein